MSKAKDRARAESGLIYRNGSLVRKEDWYAAHPTRQMLAERQAAVKDAVGAEMASKFTKAYTCTKCNRTHKPGSKVFEQHRSHAVVM